MMNKISQGYDLNVLIDEDRRQAEIGFCLIEKSEVLLRVINAGDKEVRLLLNETMPKGKHKTLFAFGNLQPDDYTIRLLINSDDAIDLETLKIKIY